MSPKIRFAGRTTIGKRVINKHRAVRDETVIADGHQLADKRMRLDPTALTDLHTFLDLHKRPNEAFVANLTAIKIHRLDNSDVFAKLDIDNARTTKFWVIYQGRRRNEEG